MKDNKKRCQILEFCDHFAFILLCAVMFDSCIFGAGELISIGPLGFRQILLVLLGISCIPVIWKRKKELICNKYSWPIIGFVVWMVFCTTIGIQNQNTQVSVDFNAFVYLIFVPLAMVTLNSKPRVQLLMKLMVLGSLILAVITIGHLVAYLVDRFFLLKLADLELELNLARIGPISEKIPRIYFLSALYMIAGCAFSFYFLTMQNDRRHTWLYCLTPGLSIFALVLSYTRSVFLGIFAAVVVVVVYVIIAMDKQALKRFVKQLCTVVAVFAIVMITFSAVAETNYLKYMFSRISVSSVDTDATGPSDGTTPEPSKPISEEEKQQNDYNSLTQLSDERRAVTIQESLQDIKASPLIGHGLGYTVASRPDGNEYSYLDLWLKTGIIGLLLYFTPFVMIVLDLFCRKSNTICTRNEKVVWFAFLLGIMVYSIFNPYINSALGIFVYACVIAVSNNKTINQDEQTV